VVLDCKFVPIHNIMPTFACCLLHNIYAVRLAESFHAKISGVGKNSPTVLAVSKPKFTKFENMQRSPFRLTSFFPMADIMFRCRDMFGQSSQSRSQKKRLLRPGPCGGLMPGEFGPNLSNRVTCECVSKFGRDLFSDLRD